MSAFSDWVQDNWPVKLDIVKGDYSGNPNQDSRVANYSVVPALLFDLFDEKYYIRYPNNWKEIADSTSEEDPSTQTDFGTVFDTLEEGNGIRIQKTYGIEGEIKTITFSSEGLVKVNKKDKGLGTLLEKIQTNSYKFPYTAATQNEENELWLLENGNVSVSSSDKAASYLYDKLQAGEGLSIYREKKTNDEERLRLSLDDETREIIYDLKYEKYSRTSEQNRSNDVYVDVKTAPYTSIRDGTMERPFLSIKQAVMSEQVQKGECTIWVMSGIYIEEAPITLPPGTSILGAELRRVRVYPTTDTCGATYDKHGGGTLLFELTSNCILRNMTIRGVVAPGFVLGFAKNANLKSISPYIQNCTSYNDGRDYHQLFAKPFTQLKPATLPNNTTFKETVEVVDEKIYIDEEEYPKLNLSVGKRYRFELKNGNNQFIRFTTNLDSYNRTDIVDLNNDEIAEEDGFISYLDLTNVKSLKETLYYVLIPDSVSNNYWGEINIVPKELYYDKYVLRPGDRVSNLKIDPLPLNMERGDPIWVGDPKEIPFAYINQSIYSGKEYTLLETSPLNSNVLAGTKLYLYNGKVAITIVLAQDALKDDIQIVVEKFSTKYDFTNNSSIHYQHPLFTEKFILREDAPKGTTVLKFGKFKTFAQSYSIPYQLNDTFEEPPNDEASLLEELERNYLVDEEIWLLETENDRDTINLFPTKIKRQSNIGTKTIALTDCFIKPSERDLMKIMKLFPSREVLEQDINLNDLPICNSYIREGSIVRKDPWRRRNGGGGAHVDGFRLRPETRFSNNPPDSRTMCFNDYTQINVNGYGVLTEGIANSECVSVFTYFCNNSLYGKNGGEVRGLNCSSAFGVYGLKAEGYLGTNLDKTEVGTPEITAEKIYLGYEYNQQLADNDQDPQPVVGETQTQVAVIENPVYNASTQNIDATPRVGSLIQVTDIGVVGIVESSKYVRNNFGSDIYVFIRIAGSWLAVNASIPSIVQLLGDLSDSNNKKGIYEFRSSVRVTGHDFGYVGSGTRLPRNVGGTGTPLPDKEVRTLDFGQVFWSASDQLGNFTVGEFFRVEAQTGSVSFNTDQFDLTGLSELGPFRDVVRGSIGTVIREVSADPQLFSIRDGQGENAGPNTIPTQTAVKQYVDQRVGAIIELSVFYTSSSEVLIGSSNELFPSLQLIRGLTYRFNLSSASGVTKSSFNLVNKNDRVLGPDDGVTNNTASVDSILYKVPLDAKEDMFYRLGEQGIVGIQNDKSTLYITNPDIRFPSGENGEIQFTAFNNDGQPIFDSTPNLKMVGNSLSGTFDGIFSGDGQFISNIRVKQELQDIENVDLGFNQQEEGDLLTFFSGREGQEGFTKEGWRLARSYLPVKLTNGNTIQVAIKYTYKEETPIEDFINGKLDFSNPRASNYLSFF